MARLGSQSHDKSRRRLQAATRLIRRRLLPASSNPTHTDDAFILSLLYMTPPLFIIISNTYFLRPEINIVLNCFTNIKNMITLLFMTF